MPRKAERKRHERVLEATFLKSAASLADCPRDAVCEIAFIGRSNAGKSSTLNALTGARKLARVSRTPGRTQLINLFDARLPWTGQRARFVDLPGYGYAKASKAKQASWGRAVDAYLERRENLVAAVLVMDARHPLQPFDVTMLEWAAAAGLPLVVLLNKSDKLKQGERAAAHKAVVHRAGAPARLDVVVFSATTGMGLAEAIEKVSAHFPAQAGTG